LINTLKNKLLEHDNGGRRSTTDRREFTYAGYMPERRSFKDRRSGFDRRLKLCIDKITIDHRKYFNNVSLSAC
jgi:hypothetical protein